MISSAVQADVTANGQRQSAGGQHTKGLMPAGRLLPNLLLRLRFRLEYVLTHRTASPLLPTPWPDRASE
jgi:hypothetical protein